MMNQKNEQLSLGEYLDHKEKQGKKRKLFDFPWPVKVLLAIPIVIFVFLLLGYIFYIRRFAAHA